MSLADHAFGRMLAACGCRRSGAVRRLATARVSASRFDSGTSAPSAPLAKLIEHELSEKLEARVRFRFDGYPRDMVSRAQVFAKLAANEDVTARQALVIAGLVEDIDDD